MSPALGALRSPEAALVNAWPIRLALAAVPTAAPLKYHSPKCHAVTIDQNPWGACVMFSDAYVHAGVEVDEGYLLPNVLDPLRTYFEVKGLPYGGPDPSPGLMPSEALQYLQRTGWATKDGSPRRKIGPYYTLGTPDSSNSFLGALQQTILQLGPFQLVSAWPGNWFSTDLRGFMKVPSATLAGGHAFEACGWEDWPNGCPTLPGCTWDSFHHQTWGAFGSDPEYPDHFRVHSPWWNRLGWESWKVTDLAGDVPPSPVPPGGTVKITDSTPKLVALPEGRQLYQVDGITPLVKMSATVVDVYSPAGGPSATQRYVVVTTGGVRQQAVVAMAGLTWKPYASDVTHTVRVFVDGVSQWEGTV